MQILSAKLTDSVTQAASSGQFFSALDMYYTITSSMRDKGIRISALEKKLAILVITQRIDMATLDGQLTNKEYDVLFRRGILHCISADISNAYSYFAEAWALKTNDITALQEAVWAGITVCPAVASPQMYRDFMQRCTNATTRNTFEHMKRLSEEDYSAILKEYNIAKSNNTVIPIYLQSDGSLALIKARRFKEACGIGKTLLDQGYTCHYYALIIGKAALEAREFDLACRAFKMAIENGKRVSDKFTVNPDTYTAYAVALYRLGKTKDARLSIREALTLDPTNRSALAVLHEFKK